MKHESYRAEALPRPEKMRRGWRLIVIYFFIIILKIFKRYEIRGCRNRITEGPAIYIGNHLSFIEIILISVSAAVWPHWIGKKELFEAPFPVPQVCRGWGMLALDRSGSDLHTARQMLAYLRDGRTLAVFPQGKRVRTLEQIKMHLPKTGFFSLAKKRGIMIQPVSAGGKKGLFRRFNIHYMEPIDPRTYRPDLPHDRARVWAVFETLYRDQGEDEAADFFRAKIEASL